MFEAGKDKFFNKSKVFFGGVALYTIHEKYNNTIFWQVKICMTTLL